MIISFRAFRVILTWFLVRFAGFSADILTNRAVETAFIGSIRFSLS